MDEGKSGSGLLVGTGLGGLGGGQIECLGLGDQIVEIGGLQRAGLLEDDLALLGDHQRGHRLDAGGLGQILVGVDINLDEGDVRVLRLVGGRLENRAERAARAAPVAQKSTNTISLSVMVFSKSAEVMAVVAMMFPSFVFSLASPYGPHAWPPGDCLIHAIRLGAWGRAVRGRRLPAGYQLPSTTQHLCRIFRRRPNVSQDFAVR